MEMIFMNTENGKKKIARQIYSSLVAKVRLKKLE